MLLSETGGITTCHLANQRLVPPHRVPMGLLEKGLGLNSITYSTPTPGTIGVV